MSTKNDDKEEKVSPSVLNSKLSPEVYIFMSKSVIAKKSSLPTRFISTNAYTIDLDKDSFDEDLEDNMPDTYFDKVTREGDIT